MTSHGSGKSHEYHRLTVISGSSRLTGIIKIPICHIYPCHHSGRYLYKTNYARQNKSKLYLHSIALSLDKTSGARQKRAGSICTHLHCLWIRQAALGKKRASSICTHLHCLLRCITKYHRLCSPLHSTYGF